MYVSRVGNIRPLDVCRSWDPNLDGVTEVFHASFTDHVYPVHCHDTWTVLLVDHGAIRYDLDRRERAAEPDLITVLPPFVAHDGQSANAGRGFHKRVLYIDTDTLGEELVSAAVDRSAMTDPDLRQAISDLHRCFERERDDLESESLLALITERITSALAGEQRPVRHSSDAAEALRAVLDEDPLGHHKLADIADSLGWNTTHLIRSFTTQFGLAPHRYLISRRVDEARRRLLGGESPADVAVEVGFHDQAHLGRHFKNHVGTTPGRYRRSPSFD